MQYGDLKLLAVCIVSQARPFPFCSADRFQYANPFVRVPHAESDGRCGTERLWPARLGGMEIPLAVYRRV